ncbi:MAG: hypothetical protein JNM10_00745 [Planctomycetia bacterium]|nr:hypothetical protein [Planctomycetia bacterium]
MPASPPGPVRLAVAVVALGVVAGLASGRGSGPSSRAFAGDAPPAAPGPSDPAPRTDPPAPVDRPPTSRDGEARWLDESGTALLGFGMLRVAPTLDGPSGQVVFRYEEAPTDYAMFDAVQLLVMPADAFARDGRAFADRALAWGRSARGTYAVSVTVKVTAPAVWLVAFGPFTGVDTSRPLGAARTYALDVREERGMSRAWVDPLAGELTVKAWTSHPEVERGGPVKDPFDGRDRWFEVRPELVYAASRLAAPGDPEPPQVAAARREADSLRQRAADLRGKGRPDAAADLEREADDVRATLAYLDERVPVPAPLAERLRRLPFRWR